MSVHLSIKMRPGKAETTHQPSSVEAQRRNHEVPMGAAPSAAASGRQPLGCLTFNRHCGNCAVTQRQAGKQVQRQKAEVIANLSQNCTQVLGLLEKTC